MDIKKAAIKLHQGGKLAVVPKLPITNQSDLSLVYTPGVAEVSRAIAEDRSLADQLTIKGHTVAVVSDGSAVLGLGNIGPEAAMPVMEGKAALFKTFAGIDAFPICLNTQNPREIVSIVKALAPVFGGINLEDIAAPRCFLVEDALQKLGIPVMHDDQHGTAVVVLAGLINAAKVVGKQMSDMTIVISGAGAAGSAITKLLNGKVKDILILDSHGMLSKNRTDLNKYKKRLARITNRQKINGNLKTALKNADVFIGVSKGNLLTAEDVRLMDDQPIVLAMANPTPEIMPEEAVKGGAVVVATGRSDFPNQINNVLAFPGIFKGALEAKATQITDEMKLAAAQALADLVEKPTAEQIIPSPFDRRVVPAVAQAVAISWKKSA